MKTFTDQLPATLYTAEATRQLDRIAIENYGLTSRQILQVLDAANHPAVGTLYDPCNYYRHGQDFVREHQ